MKKCLRVPIASSMMLVCSLVAMACPCAAQPLPEEVGRWLKRNCEAFSPVVVEWIRRRSSPLAVDRFLAETGGTSTAVDFMEPESARFCYQDGMCRMNYESRIAVFNARRVVLGLEKHVREAAFDGKLVYLGDRGRESSLTVRSLEFAKTHKAQRIHFDCGLISLAGFVIPETPREFGTDVGSVIIEHLRAGATVTNVRHEQSNGDPITILELTLGERSLSYSLDNNRGYSISTWQEHIAASRRPCRRCEMSGVTELGNGFWFPTKCTCSYYEYPVGSGRLHAEPVLREDFEVTHLSKEFIRESEFRLNYTEPGTIVFDGTLPEAMKSGKETSYVVPVDASALDGLARQWRPSRRVGLILANGVVIVFILIILVRRSRGRATS